jgi:hypothetical protein
VNIVLAQVLEDNERLFRFESTNGNHPALYCVQQKDQAAVESLLRYSPVNQRSWVFMIKEHKGGKQSFG